jgi:hypothetical protein
MRPRAHPDANAPGPRIRYALIEFPENDSRAFPGRRFVGERLWGETPEGNARESIPPALPVRTGSSDPGVLRYHLQGGHSITGGPVP